MISGQAIAMDGIITLRKQELGCQGLAGTSS
jgi:hypothetical protein